MAALFKEAGLPDGVLNVVHGDKVAVDRLLEHPGVAAISSVGSTPVARYIYETAAARGKRVQALGGAKNHMLVLPDADMDLAADSIVGAAYGSAGQRCMAISAVIAVGEAGDALRQKVHERVATLNVGPGSDPAAEMGPLVTGQHRDKVLSYVEAGLREGRTWPSTDGISRCKDTRTASSSVHAFSINVRPEMSIYTDEIFGPVLVMVRAESYAEAIELLNANPYGNGTAIFTNDGGAARKFQHEVEVGMVGVNVPIPVPMAFFSFGGWKDSLFGDAHVHGARRAVLHEGQGRNQPVARSEPAGSEPGLPQN